LDVVLRLVCSGGRWMSCLVHKHWQVLAFAAEAAHEASIKLRR
jgi:hypothetical protein